MVKLACPSTLHLHIDSYQKYQILTKIVLKSQSDNWNQEGKKKELYYGQQWVMWIGLIYSDGIKIKEVSEMINACLWW